MKTRPILRQFFSAAATLILATTANAQLFRAYLASDGSDANPCNLAQPCRLLPAALNSVADGGEIWMLDSANYNTATVNITKSVSILAVPGMVGSVLAIGGPAITITSAGLNVALRNLAVAPLTGGGGTGGVFVSSVASSLTIENCLFANLPGPGVSVSGGTARIVNSIFRNNQVAVSVQESGKGDISGTQMVGHTAAVVQVYAMQSVATPTVSVSDSFISGGSSGIEATSNYAGAVVFATVTRSTIVGTAFAARSTTYDAGTATISLNGNTITGNNFPWYATGTNAVVQSLGNNQMVNNKFVPPGALTPVGLQ